MATTKLGRIQCVEGSRKYFALLDIESVEAESEAPAAWSTISIVLTDVGSKAWKGSLNSDFLSVHAQRTKCTVDKYVSMTFSCLTEAPMSSLSLSGIDIEQDKSSKYVCQVNELENGDAELTWKRQLVADDISVKLGTTTLQASDLADCLRTILEFGVSRIRELEQLTKEQQMLEESHAQERKAIVDKLTACVASKEQMERDLYAKFVAVLNEKKAEIRRLSLTCASESVKQATLVTQVNANKKSKKSGAKRVIEKPAASDNQQSDPDDFIDDHFADSETPIVDRKKRPSSSTRNRMVDEDLLLDDDEEDHQDDDGDDDVPSMFAAHNHKRSIEKAAPSILQSDDDGDDFDEHCTGPSTASKAPKRSKDQQSGYGDTEALFDEM